MSDKATETARSIYGRAFHYDDTANVPLHMRQLYDGRWVFRTGTGHHAPILESVIPDEVARQMAGIILDPPRFLGADSEAGDV
jgi:hypothetical protein